MKKRNCKAILMAVAIALAGCSQDEPAGGDDMLPDGAYPLLLGEVTIEEQRGERPSCSGLHASVRMVESGTGDASVWEAGDVIGVRFDGGPSHYGGTPPYVERGEYVFEQAADGTLALSVVEGKEIYWRNDYGINPEAQYDGKTWYMGGIAAWYPTESPVDLSDQSQRLAYVLAGRVKPVSNFYNPEDEIPLIFTHQLAKVRVIPKGTLDVTGANIYVEGPTSCTVNDGAVTAGTETGRIKMFKTSYTGVGTCWEANLPDGVAIDRFFLELGGNIFICPVTEFVTAQGQLHNVALTLQDESAVIIDLSTLTSTYTISDDTKPYYFTGSGSYGISVTGGSPEIYLADASVSVSSGSAVSITGGATPTIHVVGNNNSLVGSQGSMGAGIYVASGSGVTIEGSGTNDELHVEGGVDGAAIGGYSSYNSNVDLSCGNITIRNVTLYAYASFDYISALSPGIGATGYDDGGGGCGRIEISQAIVYARSSADPNASPPAIGATASVPEIVINDSEIHAQRSVTRSNHRAYSDYIGRGGSRLGYGGGAVQYGSGSITNSTVYKETYNFMNGKLSNDGVVEYDASGVATEQ